MNKEDEITSKESKPVRLSLHLIVKRHLPSNAIKWTQEEILDALAKIKRLRLDRENIGYIDSLDLLGDSVTHIYLQQNSIDKICNFDSLQNIQFITLAGNRIRTIENLSHLKKLIFLDLSDNNISDFTEEEIPKSLVLLNLAGNPCTELENYRERLIQCLPKLRHLDNEDLGSKETEEGESGEEDSSEEEEISYTVKKDSPSCPDKSAKLLSGEVLMRSHDRMEDQLKIHTEHSKLLETYKKALNINKK